MSTAIYDAKMTLNNSAFLAAMAKAREAADQSIGMMSVFGGSIGDLGAKIIGLSVKGSEAFAGGTKDAMEQGRQFATQAPPVSALKELRQAFQSAGVLGKDRGTKKSVQKPVPLDHFKPTDNADRFAKLGLFIGGAPQTPGLSEARRTALATEAMRKGIDKLTQHFSNKPTGGMAVFA